MLAEVITLRPQISMGRRRGCEARWVGVVNRIASAFASFKSQPYFHVPDTAGYTIGCRRRIIRWKVNIELCVISTDVIANTVLREDI